MSREDAGTGRRSNRRGGLELEKPASRLGWVSVSYFAEGLPWSLMHQVAAEFFTAIGARPAEVGRTALLHIPILLKVIFSPFVEGYFTLRRWMLGTQLMMGVIMGGVAVVAHRVATTMHPSAADSMLLWGLLFSIGILSAVYDIACDGFYLEQLSPQDQARYSGLRVAAYRVAMLLGSFLLVFLGGLVNWLLSFSLGGLLLGSVAAVMHRVLPAQPGADEENSVSGVERREERGAYLSFLRQDSILLVMAFLFFYKAADAMMFSMSSVLLSRELGIATELRALLGVLSTFASIFGTIWGGAWIAKQGFERALVPITFLMVITEPLYLALVLAKGHLAIPPETAEQGLIAAFSSSFLQLSIVSLVLVIEKLCAGLAVAAQMIFIMRRCHPHHKTAHYAFATVVYSLAQILLGTSSGDIFEKVGAFYYYVIVSALAVPALLLSRLVPTGQRGVSDV